jgi:PTH1 family peptidyl-tRNA hydrolase
LWLIVGLGNPGSKYSGTRHNIGFLVLEEFADRCGLEFKERKLYRICSGSIKDDRFVLLEPLTFMNRSGGAVVHACRKFNIAPEHIIVVHDDLDLDTGRMKIRKKGSSGGHKGVESIIQSIGSNEFIRIKVGIGRGEPGRTEDFVLSRFRKEERPLIRDAVCKAADSIELMLTENVEKAMNKFNRGAGQTERPQDTIPSE